MLFSISWVAFGKLNFMEERTKPASLVSTYDAKIMCDKSSCRQLDQLSSMFYLFINPLPLADAFWCICNRHFWGKKDEKRNCSWWQFPPLAIIFSILFNNNTSIHRFNCYNFAQMFSKSSAADFCCKWERVNVCEMNFERRSM